MTSAQRGLQLAEEIGHQQWMAGAHWTLGMLYLDLLVPATDRQHLSHALTLAQAINSRLWRHFAIGTLALADLLDQQLDQAETTLSGRGIFELSLSTEAKTAHRLWSQWAQAGAVRLLV